MGKDNLVDSLGRRVGLLLILLITVAVYANSLVNDFVWDDTILIVGNDAYESMDLRKIFLSRANHFEYLPVYHFTLALDSQIWGMRPFGFHLTNILIYLATVGVLFRVVISLLTMVGAGEQETAFMAFWTSLIFALHPLHSEPVNFIINRNHILAALFTFMSLEFLMQALRRRGNSLFVFSFLSFVMALLSKQVVVFFPVFLVLLLFLFIPDEVPGLWRKTIILLSFGMAGLVGAAVHYANASVTNVLNENELLFRTTDWYHTIAKTVQIPFFYLKKLLLPYPLTVEYGDPFIRGNFILRAVLCGVAAITILYVAWRVRTSRPIFAIGVAFYFVSLVPVLNIFATAPMVADRYAFFPVLGFAMAASSGLWTAFSRNRYFLSIGLAAIIAYSLIIVTRNTDWKNGIALWESAIAVNPDTERRYIAEALWKQHQYERALNLLQEEQERIGGHYYTLFKGLYMLEKGRYHDAIPVLQNSLAEGGDAYKEPHYRLAYAYEKTGATLQALEEYLAAIETPSVDPMGRLGQLAEKGAARIRIRLVPDIDGLKTGALSRPMDFRLQAETGLLLQRLGLYTDAERFYQQALQIKPASPEILYNLALVYMKLQKPREAVKSFDRSVAIYPANKDAFNNMGTCYVELKDYDAAARSFESSIKIDPTYVSPLFNLGRLNFLAGKTDESRRYFREALALAGADPTLEKRIGPYISRMEKH